MCDIRRREGDLGCEAVSMEVRFWRVVAPWTWAVMVGDSYWTMERGGTVGKILLDSTGSTCFDGFFSFDISELSSRYAAVLAWTLWLTAGGARVRVSQQAGSLTAAAPGQLDDYLLVPGPTAVTD